ncbi:hypothetical protein JCM9533A_07530 [Catenuloplanes niger JCM 9533]
MAGDLTDEDWRKLAPLSPDTDPQRGGRWRDHRQVITGILWRTENGADTVPFRALGNLLQPVRFRTPFRSARTASLTVHGAAGPDKGVAGEKLTVAFLRGTLPQATARR